LDIPSAVDAKTKHHLGPITVQYQTYRQVNGNANLILGSLFSQLIGHYYNHAICKPTSSELIDNMANMNWFHND